MLPRPRFGQLRKSSISSGQYVRQIGYDMACSRQLSATTGRTVQLADCTSNWPRSALNSPTTPECESETFPVD